MTLRSFLVLSLVVGLTIGFYHLNARSEAVCQANGGQVISYPTRLSACLMPANR